MVESPCSGHLKTYTHCQWVCGTIRRPISFNYRLYTTAYMRIYACTYVLMNCKSTGGVSTGNSPVSPTTPFSCSHLEVSTVRNTAGTHTHTFTPTYTYTHSHTRALKLIAILWLCVSALEKRTTNKSNERVHKLSHFN